MTDADFQSTKIGSESLTNRTGFPVDTLLEYLHGLMVTRSLNPNNAELQKQYTREIEATKIVLTMATTGK